MAVINIRKATRNAARLVFGFAGLSGGGKTRTALEFAYGLAGYDLSKVGMIDAENKRGSLYADIFEEHPTHPTRDQFLIGDLEPPFSPDRYIEAIKEFAKAGVEVLVIDSATHEWEGTGGCEEIATTNKLGGRDNWGLAKQQHKRFMNACLQSDMHIIMCFRAREKVRYDKDANNKQIVVPLGILPVTEKNVMFEMTASLMFFDSGRSRDPLKCPEALLPMIAHDREYLNAADGFAVREWVEGGAKVNREVEAERAKLLAITEQGMDALAKAWGALPAKMKKALSPDGKGCPDDLKQSAIAFDKAKQAPADEDLDDLNAAIMGEHGNAAAAAE